MCCLSVSGLNDGIRSRLSTHQVTVSVEVSRLVMLTVAWDSTTVFGRGDSVICERTEVVLVTVEMTGGRREVHSLAAAVLEAKHPSAR